MNVEYLHHQWHALTYRYMRDQHVTDSLLIDLMCHYGEPHRKYHTLAHIESLLRIAEPFMKQLETPHDLLFSIWYHDIVYNINSRDNKLRSAETAEAALSILDYPNIEKVKANILATQTHRNGITGKSFDSDLFLDLDLAVLGNQPDNYRQYCFEIRGEYSVVPDEQFYKGRLDFLHKLMHRDFIFLTDSFRHLFEKQARENIYAEMQCLKTFQSCSPA